MTFSIRPALASDIPRMQDIERDAAELFRDSPLIDISRMGVVAITDHFAAIEAKLSFVAEVEGRTAGFVMGEMKTGGAYLHELDVATRFQQRGIGAGLVGAFVQAARMKHGMAVYLSTFRDPPWNAPFYARLGFREVARDDYLTWMAELEAQQAAFLDVATRVIMRLD